MNPSVTINISLGAQPSTTTTEGVSVSGASPGPPQLADAASSGGFEGGGGSTAMQGPPPPETSAQGSASGAADSPGPPGGEALGAAAQSETPLGPPPPGWQAAGTGATGEAGMRPTDSPSLPQPNATGELPPGYEAKPASGGKKGSDPGPPQA